MAGTDWPIGEAREYCWTHTQACKSTKLGQGWREVFVDPRYGSILLSRVAHYQPVPSDELTRKP